MKKILTIHDDVSRQAAIRFIGAASIIGGLTVTITDKKPSRSVAQNALYWQWLNLIGTEIGYSKDEMHDQVKERLLLPLMLEHSDRYPEAQDVMDMLTLAPQKKLLILSLISTTALTVHHFAQYLNEVEAFAGNMGIRLPRPDDLYHEAMGRRAA